MHGSTSSAGPVLLFDGECGLCHRIVRLLLRLDRKAKLRFAPLQGPSAQSYLRRQGLPTEDFDTLVWVSDWSRREERGSYLVRTDGAIAALETCGGVGHALARFLRMFPQRWRDTAYRCVGRTRYRIFGPWRPRPLARSEWAARFLS